MKHATPALLWELWRRSRWVILGTAPWILGVCLLLVILYSYRESVTDADSFAAILDSGAYGTSGTGMLDMAIAAMFIGLLAPMWTILLSYSDEHSLQLSLPRRILRLPLSAWHLVAVVMGYGIVAIGLIAFGMTASVKWFFESDLAWFGPVAICVCIMAGLQAWALSLGETTMRTAILSLVIPAAILFGLLWLGPVRDVLAAINPLVPMGAALVGFYLIGVWGVSFNRRNGFGDLANIRHQDADRAWLPSRRFNAPEKAQAWYEWRRYGWHLPLCVLGVLTVYFVVVPLLVGLFSGNWEMEVPTYIEQGALPEDLQQTERDSALFFVNWLTDPEIVTWGFVIAVVVSALVLGGYRFVATSNEYARSTFLFTRPISTRQFVFTRLRVVLRSVLIATGVLFAAFVVLSVIEPRILEWWSTLNFLTRGEAFLPGPVLIALYFLGLFLFMWIAAWPLEVGWFLTLLAIVFVPPFAVLWVSDLMAATPAEDPIGRAELIAQICEVLAVIVMAAGLAWMYNRGKTLGIVNKRAVQVAFGVWPLYAFAFLAYQYVEDKYGIPPYGSENYQFFLSPFDRDSGTIIWGNVAFWLAVSLLPVAPVITQPFFTHRARHRG